MLGLTVGLQTAETMQRLIHNMHMKAARHTLQRCLIIAAKCSDGLHIPSMPSCQQAHVQRHSSECSKVFLGVLGSGLHGVAAWLPACRADLIWVLLHILDGLQSALGLLDAPSKRQIVDGGVLDDSLHITRSHRKSDKSIWLSVHPPRTSIASELSSGVTSLALVGQK